MKSVKSKLISPLKTFLFFSPFFSLGILLISFSVGATDQAKTWDDSGRDLEKNFLQMERMMREMMERSFGRPGLVDKDFFSDSPGDVINGRFGQEQGHWKETDQGKVYVLPGQLKEGQFDLKVKEGQVTIQGMVEKRTENSVQTSSFHQSFPVPAGTNGNKVKVEQKEDVIQLLFPWDKKASKMGKTLSL